MEFKFLRQEVLKQADKYFNVEIETEEDLNKNLGFYNKSYKGDFETQKKKFLKYLNNKKEKYKAEQFLKIESVEEPQSLPNPLIITVEWKPSSWGKNPKAYTNYGFEGDSIGGCGYCKQSTATAEALNSSNFILNLLYKAEERRLKENPQPTRRSYIGYGSGYSALPSFEGGVGVESHRSIIEGLNLKWETVTSTKNVDVYRISL